MTGPIGSSSQYATAKPFIDQTGTASENLSGSGEDADRIRAYALYEDFYYNRPETFKVLLRGENQDPVYIPTAKKIVEAMNRFYCKNFSWVIPPSGDPGLADAESQLQMRIGNLFKRERFLSKFKNQKRMSLIRGDAMFYITADPAKQQFSRISINELNPGNYFPITDPSDKTSVIGCHIVQMVRDPREDDKSKSIAQRRTYLKGGVTYNQKLGHYERLAVGAPEGVWTEVTHWTVGKWDDRNMKKEDLEQVKGQGVVDVPMFQLPLPITSLPIYHWRNVVVDDKLFGNSEVAGIETLIQGINQGISDTQLTMILQGLGIYVTDSKPPLDASGEPTEWSMGPGSVAEIKAGGKFERITGVGSVQPALDLMQEMKSGAQEASGIPDIAAGKVDVTVAESGVSLELQLLPMLAAASEKETEVLGVMDQFFYDLKTMWFPAYEGMSFEESLSITSVVESAMPVNRSEKVQEVMLLFTSNLITIAAAQAELAKLGYSFAAGDEKQVLVDAAALAQAQQGTLESRYAQETTPPDRSLAAGAGELPDNLGLGPTAAPDPSLDPNAGMGF